MHEIKNIRLILQYDGTNYHGWQRQKDDVTIQGLIEGKLEMMTGKPVTLHASGRTDAGVHALHQVCNFITESRIPPESIKNGLNSLLPDDIFIKKSEYVEPAFHSRYSAKSKSYEYRILNTRDIDIFSRRYAWHIREELDFKEMRKCLVLIIGKHDFSAFRSSGTSNINPVREILRAELSEIHEDGNAYFFFEAEGFLKHMVRNIVGTIADAGKGRITVSDFKNILESQDRERAGYKAPPHGLFLTMVKY
ncbi:MAG: tRNA pseudouridine(38-40) synthase TruA [Desulfobacteraceae bacterium]|jgi:tRNA pseudouridine38-40 synthase